MNDPLETPESPPADRLAVGTHTRAGALAQLIASVALGDRVQALPTSAEFSEWVDRIQLRFRCTWPDVVEELTRPAPLSWPPSVEATGGVRTRWTFLLHTSLEMARISYEKALVPLPPADAAAIDWLTHIRTDWPDAESSFLQAPIMPESSVRRASAIRNELGGGSRSVIFVGDDDAASLALAHLEPDYRIWLVDVDERIIAAAQRHASLHGLNLSAVESDVRSGVPFHLSRRFDAAVIDPPRWHAAVMHFLTYASACLVEGDGARLFWSDHPSLTPDYPKVVSALPALGLSCVSVLENLHRFRATRSYLDDCGPLPEHFAFGMDWLRELIDRSDFWTHLHVLARARNTAAITEPSPASSSGKKAPR